MYDEEVGGRQQLEREGEEKTYGGYKIPSRFKDVWNR